MFKSASKRETIVTGEGVSRYTKIKDAQCVENKVVGIPVSRFWAIEDIPKVARRRPRTDQVFCKKKSCFFVIGRPKGDDDSNTYVVYTNTRGVLKRPWNEIVLNFGKKAVEYGGTEATKFEVPMEGKSDNKPTYMIRLNEKKYTWVLKEWVDKGMPKGDYKVVDLQTLIRAQARMSYQPSYDADARIMESQHQDSSISPLSGCNESFPKPPHPQQVPNGNIMVYSPLTCDPYLLSDEQKVLFLLSMFKQPQHVYYVQFPPDM